MVEPIENWLHRRPVVVIGSWPLSPTKRHLAALTLASLVPACHPADVEPPQLNLNFAGVQVVSAFPAHVDAATNAITRICGVPLRAADGALLPGQTDLQANGVELTVNLVSTDPNAGVVKPRSTGERNRSIQDGDLIDSTVLTTKTGQPSLTVAHFSMAVQCYEPHATTLAKNDCAGGVKNDTLPAKAVYFHREALRCDAHKPDTIQNLAIIVDQSGSMSGFQAMDQANCADSTRFAEELPGTVKNTNFKECRSDPLQVLVGSAVALIDDLTI